MDSNLNFIITAPTEDEAQEIDGNLLKEIQKVKPFTLKEAFVPVNVCAKQDGKIIGGVLAYAVMWDILYIDTVWTRKEYRGKGIASALVGEAEKRAIETGCKIARLSTYDFQAPKFYERLSYKKFGEIDYGHTKEIFYYKKLSEV